MRYPGNDIDLGTIIGSDDALILSRRDRARHTYAVGATRTGKTKLLEGMARQDLLAWPESECPMVVLDPHGTLYGGLIAYAAAEGLNNWPIIPLDLRRDDFVVSYNLLRKRNGVDPAVICRSFVDAIIHAWGQANTNDTPRLATWLETLLMLAYERECTLAEALQIIREPELRQRITDEVRHVVSRTTLQSARNLREGEFQDRVESTMYRVNRFLSTQLLRAVMCQTGESLDLAAVLDKGSILLANLSVEGTKIADEDAAALGSVLMTDLWTAVRRRGKREEAELRPCYVYMDEFQNYVTPTIARGLSEASGYGLHLTLAHQYPSQLTDRGDMGKMVLNSVLANAKNKIVFQLSHSDDLEVLTSILYRQVVDPNQVKDEIHATKVLGYDLQNLKGLGESTSQGTSHSREWGHSETIGHTVGSNWAHSDSIETSLSIGESKTDGETSQFSSSDGTSETTSDALALSRQRGISRSDSTAETAGEQWNEVTSKSSGDSRGQSQGHSAGLTFGSPTEEFQKELRSYQFTHLKGDERREFRRKWPQVQAMDQYQVEAFNRKWATGQSINQSATASQSQFDSEATSSSAGGNRSRGTTHTAGTTIVEGQSATHGRTAGRSSGQGRALGRQKSRGHSANLSVGMSESESVGGNEAWSNQVSESYSEGVTDSESHTQSVSWIPTLVPILGKELSSRQFVPIQEQLFRFMQFLDGQPDRHCVVRLSSMLAPVALYTHTVMAPLTTQDWVEAWSARTLAQLPFAIPLEEALKRLLDRELAFRAGVMSRGSATEPASAKRRIIARPVQREDSTEPHISE